MVTVAKGSFVSQLGLPEIDPTIDGYQFTGEQVQFLKSSCSRPFGLGYGSAYCPMTCVNTCPELNPDAKANAVEQIATLGALKPFVQNATTAALASLSLNTALITIKGGESFDVPFTANADVVETVLGLIETDLPNNLPYNMTIFV